MAQNRNYPPVTPSTYRVSLLADTSFEFVSAHTIFPYRIAGAVQRETNDFIQYVYEGNDTEPVFSNTYSIAARDTWPGDEIRGEDKGVTFTLKNGVIYKVVYTYHYFRDSKNQFTNTVSYTFSVVENKLPLKKWTITDVINRLLELAEPLRKGEVPKFKLNDEQAKKFDKILSPEFSFTKQTLRESLQEIGKVVHGEPRLVPKKSNMSIRSENFNGGIVHFGNNPGPYSSDESYIVFIDGKQYPLKYDHEADGGSDDYYLEIVGNKYSGSLKVYPSGSIEDGRWYFEIVYDMYAAQEKSGVYTKPYILKTVSQVIDSYTAWLDSNAENLVNQLDKFSGVIVEPYRDGAKTVRTENLYARIEEGNMIIPTQFPVYSVEKLEYVYVDGGAVKSVDITAWLFERSVYDTQLSSYSEQYPYSKAYGLYYTQGGKNIGGLNFHVEKAVAAVFTNYAIVNILRSATGDNTLFPFKWDSDAAAKQYPEMAFRVTYTPFYNARVAQSKVNYKDFERPAALIYNQSANVVESRAYGENLKGAVARIGNIDLSLTYRLARIRDIPKAGQMYDKNYYISAVATEYLPNCILCTIGLSKDFNRLSAYIGINSEKRYSEISQNQAVERNTLWREYIVVGDKIDPDSDTIMQRNLLRAISTVFTQDRAVNPLTNVSAWGTSYKDNEVAARINLPLISSAFGNSISFSWRYEDNYSAGAVAQYASGNGVEGYFQNNCAYTDYYGRIYYYNFILQSTGYIPQANSLTEVATKLPGETVEMGEMGYASATGDNAVILRKDNREILQCNYQIDFVTNSDIIIGSALASYCPAIRGSDVSLAAKLYVFPTELNKFTDHIEAWEDVKLSELPSADIRLGSGDGYFYVSARAFPANGKSWAIVTRQTLLAEEEVEDERGNVSKQRATYGGDLLIGQNREVTAGQGFTPIYFTKKREIFDKNAWKDRR